MLSHGSTIRESRIIANQETIANQTQLMTAPHTRVKRTTYHTPAIIETVVDTPTGTIDYVVPHRSSVHPVRFQSVLESRPIQPQGVLPPSYANQNINYLPHPRDISKLGGNHFSNNPTENNSNLKVYEDLSGYKPYTSSNQRKSFHSQQIKEKGYCERVLELFWGNRCPWWMFLVIAILVILLVLLLSYFINRHRVFYGFDTTTSMGPNRLYSNTTVINQVSDQTLPTNTVVNQPYPVSPIVSTDIPATNQPLGPPLQATTTQVNTTNVSADGIYNRVNTLKQLGPYPTNTVANDPRVASQSVVETHRTINPPVYQPSIIPNTPLMSPLGRAPTIEQVETNAMREADRYSRDMRNSVPLVQERVYHLRYFVNS